MRQERILRSLKHIGTARFVGSYSQPIEGQRPMLIPKPQKGQSTKDYVSSCMGSEAMCSEFPDPQKRYAVCMSQLESAGRNKPAPKSKGRETIRKGVRMRKGKR